MRMVVMAARLMLAMLLWAGVAAPAGAAVPPPREEAERLRADMEGQAERLRLTVETFMVQQGHRVDDRLIGQDRRIDDLRQVVMALTALCALLAALAGALAVMLGRSRAR